jgi:hypothetical protein
MFNEFERRSKADMNADVLCNCFITGMASVTLKTHAMSHHAKSVTTLTILELQILLSHMVVDSPLLGRGDFAQDDTNGNGASRGDGKRQRNNVETVTEMEARHLVRTNYLKLILRTRLEARANARVRYVTLKRFELDATVKALTPKEQQHNRDDRLCYTCRKPGHRMPNKVPDALDRVSAQGGQPKLMVAKLPW